MGILKTIALLTCGCQFIDNGQGQRVASPFISGKYIPAYSKNGTAYPACWRGSFFVNDNNTKVGEAGTVLNVSVWNGRNSKPGAGAADQFAKSVSVGQMLMMDLVFKPYKAQVRNIDGTPVLRNDGTVVETIVAGWQYVSGSRRWIMDSQKTITQEIQRGLQYINAGQQIPLEDFFARPDINFNNPNHQEAWTAWMNVLKARREMVYGAGDTFGYSIVAMPQGAVPITASTPVAAAPVTPAAPIYGGTPNPVVQVAPAAPAAPVAPVYGRETVAPVAAPAAVAPAYSVNPATTAAPTVPNVYAAV